MRNFNNWLSTFRESINGYKYYCDFPKVYKNVEDIKIELNILNSLVGSKNIESDFTALINKYPECLKAIPILIAKREKEIYCQDINGSLLYNFNILIHYTAQYSYFMKETGLFDLLSNHIINNLYDYVTGVEVGLDSNGRKNRGGHQMEDLVESYLIKAGVEYYKEMYTSEVEEKWNYDLSALSNEGKTRKRWDFVAKGKDVVYCIETNFYTGGGSKLNETARSYKMIAEEAKSIGNFKFVWITDGIGWISARNNLKETFDILETLYNIKDLEDGIFNTLFQ